MEMSIEINLRMNERWNQERENKLPPGKSRVRYSRFGCCLPLRRRQIFIDQMQMTYLALKQCRKRCSSVCKMTFSAQYRWCLLHGLTETTGKKCKNIAFNTFSNKKNHSVCSYFQWTSFTLSFAVVGVLDDVNHGVYHTFSYPFFFLFFFIPGWPHISGEKTPFYSVYSDL